MKRSLLIIAAAFGVSLAVIFGVRASTDALAVILGVVLGVLASVPTTLLLTYILTRPGSGRNPASTETPPQAPVVVINAPDKPGINSPPALPSLGPPSSARKWTVIGDTDPETEA